MYIGKCYVCVWKGIKYSGGIGTARTKWYQNHKTNAREAEDEYIMRQNSTTKFGFSSNIAPL